MNYRIIARIIGRILLAVSALMIPALLISLYDGDGATAVAFITTMLVMLAAGLPMSLTKTVRNRFYAREGFVTVGLAWIVVSLFGAVPFYLSGEIPDIVDAVFESISGFTTTGASILTDIEVLPRGLLYWRSFTNWLGGMGVLVFVMAMGPVTGEDKYSMHLLRAEFPGPKVGKLVPRIQRSAKILYEIYLIFTAAHILLLLLGGCPLFDSVTIAFSAVGTGGFSIKNDSLASYSAYVQTVTAVFMFICSINFYIYYMIFIREFKKIGKSEELRVYLIILIVSVALIAIDIYPIYGSTGLSFREAVFQVASIMSTTGYASVNFKLWPQFSRALLLVLMMIGSMAGSTGGGIKVSRTLIAVKSVRSSIYNALRPNSVNLIHVDGELADDNTVKTLNGFMMIYFLIIIASILLLSMDGFTMETNLSAVLACISNVGSGFGSVGPMLSYEIFSWPEKLLLCLNMLLGRLELFPILILFTPSAWRK